MRVELVEFLLLSYTSLQEPAVVAVVVLVVEVEGSVRLQPEPLAEQAERAALLSVGQTQPFRIKRP